VGGGGAAGAAAAGGATAGAVGAQALAVKALIAVTVIAGGGLGARAVVDRVAESSGSAVAPHVQRAGDERLGPASGLPGVAAASSAATHPAATHVSGPAHGHGAAAAKQHGKKSVAGAGAPGRARHGAQHKSNAGNHGQTQKQAGGVGNGHTPKGNAYGRARHDSAPPPQPAAPVRPEHPSTPSNGGGGGSSHGKAPADSTAGSSDPAGTSGN
jgi:hypothetical protein